MKKLLVILMFIVLNPTIYSQRINENSPKEIIQYSKIVKITDTIYSFDNVERIPTYDRCKSKKKKLIKCVKRQIGKFVASKEYTKIGESEHLEKGIYRIIAKFIIDKEGNIINIQVMFPNEKIRNEAFEIIKNIPQLNSGLENGKPVFVEYNLQIPFFIN